MACVQAASELVRDAIKDANINEEEGRKPGFRIYVVS